MNVRFLADADLNHAIVSGTRGREPAIKFFSAAEGHLEGISDSGVLEAAAVLEALLVSHDTRTMPVYFDQRLKAGMSSPGVLLASQRVPIGEVIEALVLIWSCSGPSDWVNRIHYLPSLAVHRFFG